MTQPDFSDKGPMPFYAVVDTTKLLQLASAANEAVIRYRETREANPYLVHAGFRAANALTDAVDVLTSAIVEEANR